MADTKISDLPAVTDMVAGDEYVLARSGASKKIDVTDLAAAIVATGASSSLAILRDEKSANTAGGAATTGSFQTRTLNTESYDPDGIVSLSSNQFTLGAGTYLIRARAPFFRTDRTTIKIRNVTDSTDAIIGTPAFSTVGSSGDSIHCFVEGVVVLAGSKALSLMYQCDSNDSGNTNTLGIAGNHGVTEVYSVVQIEKLA